MWYHGSISFWKGGTGDAQAIRPVSARGLGAAGPGCRPRRRRGSPGIPPGRGGKPPAADAAPGAGRRPRNACRAVCVRSAFGDAPRPPRQSLRPGLYGPRPVRRGAASGARWDDARPVFDRLPFRGRLRGDLQLFGHPDGPVCGFLCVGAHAVAQRAAVFCAIARPWARWTLCRSKTLPPLLGSPRGAWCAALRL